MNKESAKKRTAPKAKAAKAENNQDNGDEIQKKRKLNPQKQNKFPPKTNETQPQKQQKQEPFKQIQGKKAFKQNEKQANKNFNNQNKFNAKPSKQENSVEEKKHGNEEDLEFDEEGGKNLILITKMNKLATKLFDKKKESAAEKPKIIEKILGKIAPLLPKLINKRNASKFIQACYKFGTAEQRHKIFESLKGTNLADVFKSKYGHFLLVKMMKKGTKEQKNKLFDEILKNALFFASHKEAGQVMDAFFKECGTPQQINKIKNLFKVDPTQKTERLENIAMRIIEKDLTSYHLSQFILSKVFKILIPNEREKVLEKFKDNILDLAKSKEGISLALEIINYSNNKQKKLILKSLKGKVWESIQDAVNKKFLIILKLLGSVDDREVLNKYLIKEIIANLDDILKNHNGINLISSIIIPKHNTLTNMEKEKVTTCKKDDVVRNEEIISLLFPHLIASLEMNLGTFLKDLSLSRVIATILQKVVADDVLFEEHQKFVEKTCECFETEMQTGFDTNDPVEINKKYLITHPDANRVLKCIIRLSNETKCEAAKSFLEGKVEAIYEFLAKNMLLYLKTRLIFLVIALIENTNYKEALVQNISKIKNKIPENTQGLNILKQII